MNGEPMPIRFGLAALAALLSACSAVPRSGPLVADVIAEATSPEALGFALVETDAIVVEQLAAAAGEADFASLPGASPVYGARLRAGDRVGVMLFEATGGGLFGGGPDTAAGVRELPVQTVSAAGTIRIPYGGNVRVRGLTPESAARRIEAALAGQAIEPQAVVSVLASPSASVTVIGDAVASGGRVPLTGTGERLLDMVAAAGGLTKPIYESALRLTREERSGLLPVGRLLESPAQNVAVRPADLISVEHRPRHFSVLGAVGQNDKIAFDRSSLMLDEALGMARGLIDARADPAGVFVLRDEASEIAAAMPGVPKALVAPGQGAVPTVYQLDFTKPSGLLLAKRFPVRHRDTLYVANAEFNSAEKVLRLLAQALQPVTTGAVIGNLVVN